MQGLYAITEALCTGQVLLNKVEAALQGGVNLLQYRDKSNDQTRRLKDGLRLQQLCQQYHTTFIINDDVELAFQLQTDGVHLGQNDASVQDARRRLGETAIIGISCYNQFKLAQCAENEGVDYVAFGSMFVSPTKPNAPQADLALLRRAKEKISVPICTIGGITLDNASQLIENGADMIAVISHLFAQPDIKSTARQFSTLFN